MFFRAFAFIACSVILVGCAAQPPITHSESIKTKSVSPMATLIVPENIFFEEKSPASIQDIPVLFNNYRHLGSGEYPDINQLQWSIHENKFTVEKFKAFYARSTQSDMDKVSILYEGTTTLAKKGRSYQIDFFLVNKNYYAKPNQVTGKVRYQVDFTIEEVVESLAAAVLPLKLEIDSEFNPESTYANLARLTEKEIFHGSGKKDPVTGKIFRERFWVQIPGKKIPVNIETYPYRNGSKVIVYAKLPGDLVGNTIDFEKMADALKNEIERIVRS